MPPGTAPRRGCGRRNQMSPRRFALPVLLAVALLAPLALAQKKNPKGGAKGAASASASASASAAPDSAAASASPASASPEAAPADSAAPGGSAPAATVAESSAPEWDINDVSEDPSKRYYFVGLRYRF